MKSLVAIPLILIGAGLPALAQGYANMLLPGTNIEVRTDTPVTVAKWDRGRIYPGYVAHDVFNRDGSLAIPRGAQCEMIVRQVGPGELALDLESMTVSGRRYVLDTTGPMFNMNREQYNNGAGMVGNIIGAIAGAAGANVQFRGDRVQVPAGAILTFQLEQPLHIANWQDPGYMQNGARYHHDGDWYR